MSTGWANGWVEVDGIVLRYRLENPDADATPLVLVHEMGGMLESWDAVVPELARDRPVLSYDQRGSGLSEKPGGALEIDRLADDLVSLPVRLGLRRPVAVAGCAVGAAVAIHAAARHPGRVAALIAMAPATGLPHERVHRALSHADRLERQGLRAATLDPSQLPRPNGDPRDPAEAARCRRLANDPQGVAALWRMLAGLRMEEDFTRVRCPSLVIAGRRDSYRPPAEVAAVAERIPGGRYLDLDTGHIMAAETPELVAQAVREFLAGL